jgi:hypothetical protein
MKTFKRNFLLFSNFVAVTTAVTKYPKNSTNLLASWQHKTKINNLLKIPSLLEDPRFL